MENVRDAANFIRKYSDMALEPNADPESVYRAAINDAASSLKQVEAICAQSYFSRKLSKLKSEVNVKV